MLRHHLIPKLTLAFSIACSVAASALGAPAWAANADVPQTNFVDLTGGQAPVAAPASSASTQTKFIDLTGGNTTAPAAPPATAGSTAVRSVDLTNGATAPTPTRIDAARVPKTKTIDLAVPGAEDGFQPNAVAGCLVLFIPLQLALLLRPDRRPDGDRKSTRLNSSH